MGDAGYFAWHAATVIIDKSRTYAHAFAIPEPVITAPLTAVASGRSHQDGLTRMNTTRPEQGASIADRLAGR